MVVGTGTSYFSRTALITVIHWWKIMASNFSVGPKALGRCINPRLIQLVRLYEPRKPEKLN